MHRIVGFALIVAITVSAWVAGLAAGEIWTLQPQRYVIVSSENREVGTALYFNVDSLPASVTIDRAVLTLVPVFDTAGAAEYDLLVVALSSQWDANSVLPGDTLNRSETLRRVVHVEASNEASIRIDVTSFVLSWYLGHHSRDGFIVSILDRDEVQQFHIHQRSGVPEASLTIWFSK